MLYNDYLAHHGIKGQKWGIRRFQNEDGTLTTEGKEKYGIAGSKFRKPLNAMGGPGSPRRPRGAVSYTAQNSSKNNRKDIAKKVAIGTAAVAATAALGYLAYKKSTKLRDVLRTNASEEAKNWMSKHIGSTIERVHRESEARANRASRNHFNKRGNYEEALIRDAQMKTAMKKAHEARQAAKDAETNYEKYKKIAETATRRDAIRLALNERVPKRSSRKAKDLNVINVLNRRQKYGGFDTRWSIDGTMYKVRKGK